MSEPNDSEIRDDRGGDHLAFKLGRAGGRFALRPVRAAANAGKDALADEAARAIDGLMAGPLPEAVGRSVVAHRVIERLVASALETRAEAAGATAAPRLDPDNPEIAQMVADAIHSRLAVEVADELTRSAAFKQVLTNVLTSPELRQALEQQTVGFGAELAVAATRRAQNADDSIEAHAHRWFRRPPAEAPAAYAGLATRGTALVADVVLEQLVFVLGGALIGLVASLFGTLRPTWLVGALAGIGWLVVVVVYFVGFWTVAGQTPGMRMMGVRVIDGSGKAPSGWRALVRLVGLALAIIPLFAGFLPALFDRRRRALQDYMAGTTVVYDPRP